MAKKVGTVSESSMRNNEEEVLASAFGTILQVDECAWDLRKEWQQWPSHGRYQNCAISAEQMCQGNSKQMPEKQQVSDHQQLRRGMSRVGDSLDDPGPSGGRMYNHGDYFNPATSTQFDRAPGGHRRADDVRVYQTSRMPVSETLSPQADHTKIPPSGSPPNLSNKFPKLKLVSSDAENLIPKRQEMHHRIDGAPTSISSAFNEYRPVTLDFIEHFTAKHGVQRVPRFDFPVEKPEETLLEAVENNRHTADLSVPNCSWNGTLPTVTCSKPEYSRKVFIGGVPWDMTADDLQVSFSSFGHITVEFPKSPKDLIQQVNNRHNHQDSPSHTGYVYVVFEDGMHVNAMLQACFKRCFAYGEEYYFEVLSKRGKRKEVQVIPWLLGNSNYVASTCHSETLDDTTIFVGALHGMINAKGLAMVMNELFGNVCCASIDIDKYKYPIGSGRVSFTSSDSYLMAVRAEVVEIKTCRFAKKVQIEPYLGESLCQICCKDIGLFFCKNLGCFKYYCETCWQIQHQNVDPLYNVHKPLCRNVKRVSAVTVRKLPEIRAVQQHPSMMRVHSRN